MRVLIVEDEQDLQNILVKRLNAEHYSVDACGNGECLGLYKHGYLRFDCA